MIRTCWLTPETAPNSVAVHAPLRIHRRALAARGIEVRILHALDAERPAVDILFVDSKFARGPWSESHAQAIPYLREARKTAKRVCWLDTTDSTGTMHVEILPQVDRYFALQLLRDREQYAQPFVGDRIFTDYYHRTWGIDPADSPPSSVVPAEHLDRLRVLWNSGLGNWGRHATLANKLLRFCPFLSRFVLGGSPAKPSRPVPVTCRMSRGHGRKLITCQRDRVAALLENDFDVVTDPVSRRAYLDEMGAAHVGVSPFGWGEMAYRDYEIMRFGAALFKPDMTHMETWPDWYRDGETCRTFRWDLADFSDTLRELLAGDTAEAIAANGQREYRRHLHGSESRELFCRRLEAILRELL